MKETENKSLLQNQMLLGKYIENILTEDVNNNPDFSQNPYLSNQDENGTGGYDDAINSLYDYIYSNHANIVNEYIQKDTDKIFELTESVTRMIGKTGYPAYGNYFKLDQMYNEGRGLSIKVELEHDDGFKINIKLSNYDQSYSFFFVPVRIEDSGRVTITGNRKRGTRIYFSHMYVYEKISKGFVSIEMINESLNEYKKIKEEFQSKLNEVKEKESTNQYLLDFMKNNKITYESLNTIKSRMLLETINAKDSDEDSDDESKLTTINEIMSIDI